MSFAYDNRKRVNYTHAISAATNQSLVLKADQKITLKSVTFFSQATGTANTYQLENWGTAGTAIKAGASGTVVAGISGTALVAATPLAGSLVSGSETLATGEYLVLRHTKSAGDGFPEKQVNIEVSYVLGVGV